MFVSLEELLRAIAVETFAQWTAMPVQTYLLSTRRIQGTHPTILKKYWMLKFRVGSPANYADRLP